MLILMQKEPHHEKFFRKSGDQFVDEGIYRLAQKEVLYVLSHIDNPALITRWERYKSQVHILLNAWHAGLSHLLPTSLTPKSL